MPDDTNWEALKLELQKAPQIKAFLKQLSQDFLKSDSSAMAFIEAIASLVDEI